MATFTICKYFVETCANNESLLANSLCHFIPDCPLRIAVDQQGKVLKDYKSIAEESGIITSWLSLLSYRDSLVLDIIRLNDDDLEGTDLYFNLSAATAIPRPLVCDGKQQYNDYPCAEYGVTLVDAAEARRTIEDASKNSSSTVIVGEINVTQGDSSPITKGNENVFRKKS